MNYSRRGFGWSLTALVAGRAEASGKMTLPSKTYDFERLPVRVNGPNRSRAVFDGTTLAGFPVELHLTELAPGQAPHPPHHHVHEEVLMIREGLLEVTVGGDSTRLGPGSVVYVASNQHHGWQNVGTTQAHYFVFALGRKN